MDFEQPEGQNKCGHANLRRDYSCGMDSGDRICCDCGEVLSVIDMRERRDEERQRGQRPWEGPPGPRT